MQKPGQRQVEVAVKLRQARERSGRQRCPMVTPQTADDLFPLRLADQIVVVPQQLGLGIVGIAAGQPEKHASGIERNHRLEFLGQQYARLVGLADERGSEAQFPKLASATRINSSSP